MKILNRAFCIFPITLGRGYRSTPNIGPTTKRSQIEASLITYFSEKFQGVSEEIWKNRGSQIDPLGISRVNGLLTLGRINPMGVPGKPGLARIRTCLSQSSSKHDGPELPHLLAPSITLISFYT